MAEYIKRDDAILAVKKAPISFMGTMIELLDDIEDIPAADVRPVVRGKWKLGGYGQISDATEKWYDHFLSGGFFYCSACKERSSIKSNFCPNCGADMGGEDDGL